LIGDAGRAGLQRQIDIAFQIGNDFMRLPLGRFRAVDPKHRLLARCEALTLLNAAIAAQHPNLVCAELPLVAGLRRNRNRIGRVGLGQLHLGRNRGGVEQKDAKCKKLETAY